MSLAFHKRLKTAETQLGISGADTFVGDKVFTGVVKFSSAVVAAAGVDATDAAAITKQVNVVTGADGAKGVALPAAASGIPIKIFNAGTAILLVYPINGGNDNINSLAEDLPYTMLPGEEAWFESTSATQWYTAFGLGKSQLARSSTQFDAVTGTTGATLTNVVGLVLPVVPGTYKFDIHLGTVATANSGLKVGLKFGVASMLTSIEYQAEGFTASAVAVSRGTTATDAASIIASTTAILKAELTGSFIVAAGKSGTLQLQAAQNAAHADTTSVFVGSTMEFTRIA